MYAIVEIAGQQFKVAKDQKVFVNRLGGKEGDSVSFDKVLLTGDGDNVTVGAPAIDGALVGAKINRHLKGDKVVVFKKKRRKGYRVKNGHRQSLTELIIEEISVNGKKKSSAKSEKAAPKKETAKKETKAAEKPAEKKTSKKAKSDDLKKIEGVGPKAAEALTNAGLDTFAKVSEKTADEIKEILSEASSTLAHLDPETWPKQAKLAAEGKWDELEKWQDELNGGK